MALMLHHPTNRRSQRCGFSLAELLVVMGVIALLMAITVPMLQLARRQAMQTQCAANLQRIGLGLKHANTEFGFYPLWDDGGAPIRYTWLDVLVQRHLIGVAANTKNAGAGVSGRPRVQQGYCPSDRLPDAMNAARYSDLTYPLNRNRGGIDYSYGIGAPLSAGGWAWRSSASDTRPRRFRDYDRGEAGRLLASDATSSVVYNMSGEAIRSNVWNDPTQFDNTIAWTRHVGSDADLPSANVLFQDGHVSRVPFSLVAATPVNTSRNYVWHNGEPIGVSPADENEGQWYPNEPPPSFTSTPQGAIFPNELHPAWYTANHAWTEIPHK